MAKLGDICTINMGQSPSSSTYNSTGEGLPFFQGNADFGDIHPTVRTWCSNPIKIAEKGDLLISVRAPIGALNIANEQCCIGRGLAALTNCTKNIYKEYLWFALLSKIDELNSKGTGSTFKSINKKILAETSIPLPSLERQKQIAKQLICLATLLSRKKQQLSKLDQLVKSRFIEMFGDPVENEKGWEMIPLSELGTCKNGMNFASDEDGIEIAYLGVGDFKDNSRIDGVSGLSQISLNTMPSEEYLLKDEDIVFVRSNGSKELVGRCLAVYPGNEKLTFSGFCIRWRKNSDKVMTDFLLQVLKTENVRILMRGRGANIQNLNQQILGKLMIPVPNMALQQSFVEFVGAIDKSKLAIYKIKNMYWEGD